MQQSELRKRHFQQQHDTSQHDHHHHEGCDHDDHHHTERQMPQSTQPSFLLSCCTNLSYFIVVTCLIFGFFITNEQFSFIREEKRQLDFIKVPVNDKSDY